MSEYQYYEFRAIDRRLDDRQMQKLRSASSRAEITPTGFVNEYHYGDFRGNPAEWMEKYFDAFVYYANWGTRQFMLRFPKRHLNADAVTAYCIGDSASLKAKGDRLILSFEADYEGCEWIEAEGWLDSMISLRRVADFKQATSQL
jgi:hypothetical protein